MVLSISIPPEAEAKLRSRAAASGQDLPSYVSRLVSQFAASPVRLEELSGPVQQRFIESGMTDDELSDLLERAKHEARKERRAGRKP